MRAHTEPLTTRISDPCRFSRPAHRAATEWAWQRVRQMTMRFALLLLAALSVVCAAPSAHAQANPDRGITTGTAAASGTSVRWGTANVVLDYPMAEVEALVHDYASFQDYLPHFRTSRVLSQRGNRALVYIEVTAINETVTLWANTQVSSRTEGERRIVDANMTRGNMDAFRVRWTLTPVDEGHTRVQFRLLADPDLPLPSSLITSENEKFARRVCRAMRQRLESR